MSRMAPPPHLVSLALNAWACYLVWNWVGNPKFEIRNPKFENRKSIQVDTHYNPPMAFRSRRIPRDLSVNRLAAARTRLVEIPFDLTLSNRLQRLGNPSLCVRRHPEASPVPSSISTFPPQASY